MLGILLEQAINHLLLIDSDIDISELEGKTIALSIEQTPFDWTIVFINGAVRFISNQGEKSDITVSLGASALLALLKGSDAKTLLKEDKIQVVGDAKIAQALFDLLTNLDINHEEIVAHFSNDFVARGVSKGVAFVKDNPPPTAIIDFAKKIKNSIVSVHR